jgi:2-polyprenyl-6-methoxyphenol hydroxylase-like FAD-dependent oxidoreductase
MQLFDQQVCLSLTALHRLTSPRYELNKFLIQKAESAGAIIFFGHELDPNSTHFAANGGDVGSTLTFKVNNSDGTSTLKEVHCACPVIGCDGGGSRARYAMANEGLLQFTESLLGTEKYPMRLPHCSDPSLLSVADLLTPTKKSCSRPGQVSCLMASTSGHEEITC